VADHPNGALIERFYAAFQARDADAMNACYHPDVSFSDAAFGPLTGDEARAMWRMLCERGKDLRVEFRDVQADDRSGSAHWEAWYTFSATGKPVHNVIEAHFEFADGLIRRHDDRFDFGRWAGQALGLPGKLLGRAPFFQKAFRRKARAQLARFAR
jgi:ketosteroid isomerase-like protein